LLITFLSRNNALEMMLLMEWSLLVSQNHTLLLFRLQPVVYELGKISDILHQADSGQLYLKPGQPLQVRASKDDLDERYAYVDPGRKDLA
jgi:hypothetical protein